MSDETLDPELSAMEAGLQALTPRTPGINRDRLLFLAGRASAKRRTAGLVAWAGGSTLVAAGLVVALLFRPPRVVEVQIVRWLPAPAETLNLTADSTHSAVSAAVLSAPHFDTRTQPYGQVQLRRLAFDYGFDALPQGSNVNPDSQYPVTVDEPPSAGSRVWWQLAHP